MIHWILEGVWAVSGECTRASCTWEVAWTSCLSCCSSFAQDLLNQVAKHYPEDTPVPSEAWLWYQFWPKKSFKKLASQYTGHLNVKHPVQARQFRKFHLYVHYAQRSIGSLGALLWSTCTASLVDKHYCKVGKPNNSVAVVQCGKAVLVSPDKAFTVTDHCFTRFSLIPSVALVMNILATPDESFNWG